MIDLDAIKARLDVATSGPWWTDETAEMDAVLIANAPGDITALVAEVERLREVNDGYLLEMGRQLALLRDQKRGENAERAAVVAWLRDVADDPETFVEEATLLRSTSNAIERGEHRRKEEE